jgi:hypothetical protein
MDSIEDRTRHIGLTLKPSERHALKEYADANGYPTLSAAIRAALPNVFLEAAREGRKHGFSPKKKTA